MARWPLHPAPFDDEPLSSWITRLASAYEMAPIAFCYDALAFPRHQSLQELDACPPAGLITMLADHTGWSIARVEAMTLRHYEGIVFETLDRAAPHALSALLPQFHPDRRHGDDRAHEPRQWRQLTPWLLPRESATALPFCSLCIAEDPVVYPRMIWSLAFTTVCRRHEVVLRESCPACAQPVLRPWGGLVSQGWARCWCGAAFAQAPTVRAPAPVVWLATRTHEALTTGDVVLDANVSMPARAYFAILRAFVESVRLRWAGQPWAASCWRWLGLDPTVMRPQLAVPFEVQPLPWRLRILELVGQLLRPWPHAFVESCQRVSLTGRTLLRRVQGLPAALLGPLVEVLGAQDPPMVTRFLIETGMTSPDLWQAPRAWAHGYLSACRRAGLSTVAIRSRSRAFPRSLYDALDDILFDERVERAVDRALERARLRWGQGKP
jgi:TniQ